MQTSRSLQSVLLVRTVPESVEMSLCFFYEGRQVNFLRKRSDPLETVLKRMRLNLAKLGKKEEVFAIEFLNEKAQTCRETELGRVVEEAATFRVGEKSYQVVKNAPRPLSVCLLHPIIAGAPALFKIDAENFGNFGDFRLSWRVNETVGEGVEFVPDNAETGRQVHLTVCNPGLPEFAVTSPQTERTVILEDPGFAPFSVKQKLDRTLPAKLRIGTWNILAQGYVTTDVARTVMYPHIKDENVLQFAYRNSLIVRELLNFNGDLLFLQEVSPSFLELCFKPFLEPLGFQATVAMKANSQRPNGVAVVSRNERFNLTEQLQWSLGGDELKSEFSTAEWSKLVAEFGRHFDEVVIPNITTVAAVAVLGGQPCEDMVICVSTHLFYHPLGGHVRLLQMIALTRKIARLTEKAYPNASIILGGDLNSRPDRAAIQFLKNGTISASDSDWQFGPVFRWNFENEDEEPVVPEKVTEGRPNVQGIDAVHSLKLKWTFGNKSQNLPQLTHATASFRAVLDYLFISAGFRVTHDFPELQVSHEAIDTVGGLPCGNYGSDHVLVGAELS